jgi:hypothetical protein
VADVQTRSSQGTECHHVGTENLAPSHQSILHLAANESIVTALNTKSISNYSAQSEGKCEVDEMTAGLVFLGAESRPVFTQRFWEIHTEADLGYEFRHLNIVSLFNLSNSSATYPFISLWSSDSGILDLYDTIPTDANCMR